MLVSLYCRYFLRVYIHLTLSLIIYLLDNSLEPFIGLV